MSDPQRRPGDDLETIACHRCSLVCPPARGARTEPTTILIVDDDPDILEALAEILDAEGFAVDRARNGKEALERMELKLPALILLDLMMPVMDGWEFSQQLRKRPEAMAKTPIIVLSADRNVSSKAKDIGAVGYLAKPFELGDLLALVRQALGSA